jgi:hypothetical protein
MPTETPAQYRARVNSNAAKSGAKPPVMSGKVPSPTASYTSLPKVQVINKPVIGPGLPSRINKPLGGALPTVPAGPPAMGRLMSDRGGNK